MLKYADDEMKKHLQPPANDQPENERQQVLPEYRHKFKYVDGIERLKNMPLPFLLDLPNGICEGIFCVAANNGFSFTFENIFFTIFFAFFQMLQMQ